MSAEAQRHIAGTLNLVGAFQIEYHVFHLRNDTSRSFAVVQDYHLVTIILH